MDDRTFQASQDDLKRKITGFWDRWSTFYDYDGLLNRDLILQEEAAWKGFFSREFGSRRLKILDVGTGTGFLSIPLAELGHEVVGLDMSEGMMSKCSKKTKERKIRIDLRRGDAEALPFDDNSFDVVVSRWVLWTLLHPDRAVCEWIRVLRPFGSAYAFDTPFVGKDWNGFEMRVRRNTARVMISIKERRNALSEKYDRNIEDLLPLNYSKRESFEKQLNLFTECGFEYVTTSKMHEVSEASKERWSRMPWRYKLFGRGNWEWHYIKGKTR